MKKKQQKPLRRKRFLQRNKFLLVVFFAVAASYITYSAFAFGPPLPVTKPPTSSTGQGTIPPQGCSENTQCGGGGSSTGQGASSPGEQRNQSTPCSDANDLKDNCIVKDIQQIVDFLSAGVAIVVIAVIILGGVQYITAGNSPEAVAKAKGRMTNGLMALIAFMFMWAFLQWLIPGGVFG